MRLRVRRSSKRYPRGYGHSQVGGLEDRGSCTLIWKERYSHSRYDNSDIPDGFLEEAGMKQSLEGWVYLNGEEGTRASEQTGQENMHHGTQGREVTLANEYTKLRFPIEMC